MYMTLDISFKSQCAIHHTLCSLWVTCSVPGSGFLSQLGCSWSQDNGEQSPQPTCHGHLMWTRNKLSGLKSLRFSGCFVFLSVLVFFVCLRITQRIQIDRCIDSPYYISHLHSLTYLLQWHHCLCPGTYALYFKRGLLLFFYLYVCILVFSFSRSVVWCDISYDYLSFLDQINIDPMDSFSIQKEWKWSSQVSTKFVSSAIPSATTWNPLYL